MMMPRIREDFFNDEERDGFFVPGKMKRAWAAELKMLNTFADVCGRNGLRWWADYGTLLGAVRHHGYIPWDDDIDISMPRKDYEIFRQIWQREFPFHYAVKTSSSHSDAPMAWMTLFNRNRMDTGVYEEEAIITEKFYGCPYICGIDVFPLDHVPSDEAERKELKEMLRVVYNVAVNYDYYEQIGSLEDGIDKIERMTGQTLSRDDSLRSALWRLGERLSVMYEKEESCGYAVMAEWSLDKSPIRPFSCYASTESLPFEMLSILVPGGYEEILGLLYGDWKMPVQGGADHNYPFYRLQDQLKG